jgi:hypothetical protein
MHSSASDESLDGHHGCISVAMPGDSGMLPAEIRGPCERHLDGRYMEICIS